MLRGMCKLSEPSSAVGNESRLRGLLQHNDGGYYGSRNFALALGRANSNHHPARASLALGDLGWHPHLMFLVAQASRS